MIGKEVLLHLSTFEKKGQNVEVSFCKNNYTASDQETGITIKTFAFPISQDLGLVVS